MSTDDLLEALRILRADAEGAEPAATQLVRLAADEADGEVVRFETRFKTEESIVAKLERFKRRKPPHYRLDKFNDALRYTIVIPDGAYWTGCLAAAQLLGTSSYFVEEEPQGWRAGYAGVNLTVRDPAARPFEVQLHTPASLEFAEFTHPLYAEWRAMDRKTPAARFIRRALDAAAAQVPLPQGVPRV